MPNIANTYKRVPHVAVPVNTSLPAITGTPEIGETLTVSTGTWANMPLSYTYQWKRDNAAIGGATNNTYLIPSTTGGLSCTVRATNAAGSASVRASSGEPRQLWLCGDSLIAALTTLVQDAMDAEFGANAWIVHNVAHSGDAIAQMETRAQAQVDPAIHHGHGVVFFYEYVNQGALSTAAEIADLLFDFGEARAAAGGLAVYSTTPHNGDMGSGQNGDEVHEASELVRAGYAGHGGVGLVDFDDPTLRADIISFDGIHWTSDTYELAAQKIAEGIVAAGLTGGCGDLRIYEPVFINLRTLTAAYVYDPINPLPYPAVATSLEVTAGTGWDLVTHTISGAADNFPTDDGPQTIYGISPEQDAGGLSGGTYELS